MMKYLKKYYSEIIIALVVLWNAINMALVNKENFVALPWWWLGLPIWILFAWYLWWFIRRCIRCTAPRFVR